MHDELGARMKEQYEQRTKYYLPRRTYTIIRIDGKAFHTFTKGFDRPYDDDLISMMNTAATVLCENVIGCKLAYVQSDEITLVLTDFDKQETQAYFNGNIQKIASITASAATAAFNSKLACYFHDPVVAELGHTHKFTNKGGLKTALFDSRVFTIPDKEEVLNNFIWRQHDAIRNSIQMVASSLYSPKEMHGKNCSVLREMIKERGGNWEALDAQYRQGRIVTKEYYKKEGALRSKWVAKGAFNFVENREDLDKLLKGIYNIEGVENG
jgi:tRNA(His) 5'-end guanylyltransferase